MYRYMYFYSFESATPAAHQAFIAETIFRTTFPRIKKVVCIDSNHAT